MSIISSLKAYLPILALLLMFFAKPSTAEVIVLGDDPGTTELVSQVEIFEDEAGLSVNEVTSAEFQHFFKPHDRTTLNFGVSNSTYWLRFKLAVGSDDSSWYLLIDRVINGELDLFIIPQSAPLYAPDISEVLYFKQDSHRTPLYRLNLTEGELYTVYVRARDQKSFLLLLLNLLI